MTRVLMFLSNGFTHDPRVDAEARSLARAGHEVTVLCWDRAGTLPQEEVRDGIRVVRLRNNVLMRLAGYDLFRLRPFWWLAARRALELHRQNPFHVLHSHDLDTLPAAVTVKRRTGLPLIYDAHEFFPWMIADLSRAKPWAGRFAALERRLIREADLVLTPARPHHEYFAKLTDRPVVVVSNSRPLVYDAYEPPANPRMTVLYVGSMYPGRFLAELAEVAAEDGSFDVEFAGPGPVASTVRDIAAKSRGNVRYLGVVPMSEVIPRTRAADLVHGILDPSMRLFRLAAPNKFYEALVAGRPIVVSKGTWVGDQVEAAGCGLAVDFTEAALRDALRTLAADPAARERMGRNALRLAQTTHNWTRDEASLLGAYRQLGL